MTPISVAQTGTGRSAVLSLDNFTNPYNVGLHYTVSGTATFNLEITPQDPMDATPTIWNVPTGLSGLTADGVQALTIPARGITVNITGVADTGTVTLYVVQAGLR